jgi:hypothetical protein
MQSLTHKQVQDINNAAHFITQDAMRLIDYTNHGAARTIEQRMSRVFSGCKYIAFLFYIANKPTNQQDDAQNYL